MSSPSPPAAKEAPPPPPPTAKQAPPPPPPTPPAAKKAPPPPPPPAAKQAPPPPPPPAAKEAPPPPPPAAKQAPPPPPPPTPPAAKEAPPPPPPTAKQAPPPPPPPPTPPAAKKAPPPPPPPAAKQAPPPPPPPAAKEAPPPPPPAAKQAPPPPPPPAAKEAPPPPPPAAKQAPPPPPPPAAKQAPPPPPPPAAKEAPPPPPPAAKQAPPPPPPAAKQAPPPTPPAAKQAPPPPPPPAAKEAPPPPPPAAKQAPPPPPPAAKQAPPPTPPAAKQAPPPAAKQPPPPPPPAAKEAPPPPPPPAAKEAPPPPPPPAAKQAPPPPPPPAAKQAPPPPPPPAAKEAPPPPPPAAKQAPPPPPPPTPPAAKQAPPPPPPAAKQAPPPPPPPAAKEAPPPPPPAAKQAPPPTPPAAKQASRPLLEALKKLGGFVVPSALSAVNLGGTSLPKRSPLRASMLTVMRDNRSLANGMISPLLEGGSDVEQHRPRETSDVFLTRDDCDDSGLRNCTGESPDSSFLIREKLLQLLGGIACSKDEVSYTATSPEVVMKDNKNGIPSCYGEEHVVLDDLFIHLLSALEKVVHEFLCRSLSREWRSKLCGGLSPKSSPGRETARLWATAWRQAEHRDEEAWIAWRSALCRSWRRTRREIASQERSQSLNVALFQFDPLGGASTQSALKPSRHGVEMHQAEKEATTQKLYTLLYRLFWTCPALLLDGTTQRLAAATGLNLDSVRQDICVVEGSDDACDDVVSFIRSLSCREEVRVGKAELADLDEVVRLFAAERRALLCRLDSGQLPPSFSSPVMASFPAPPAVSPHSPCSPSLHSITPTRSSAASFSQYIEPTPIQLRPPSFASPGCFSPAARIPDGVERQLAGQPTAPPNYETAFRVSDDHLDAPETRKETRKNGSDGRRALWHADWGKDVSASRSSQPRLLNTTHSGRRLPSALRTPRSVSLW